MNYRDPTRSISERIADLLQQMTLPEKISQLGSCWFYELQSKGCLDVQKVEQKLRLGIGQISRVAGASTLTPLEAARTANQLQHYLVEHTRLGIPAILHEECCSGSLALGASMFPQIIGLASTFQPELAQKMTTEIRKQLRAVGVHQGLGPVLDVGRDPRWGRVEETFGEDPLLISQFGMAYIRGLQGEDLKTGVMATGKHFVGHSLSQGGLNCAPVQLGKHSLWDVYLMPFQAAIRGAGLASVMNAYPELDEEVVAASREIMTRLLRDQLGFNGLVVSDYEAVRMIHTYHHVAADELEAAALALNAGIDVELPTTQCYTLDLIGLIEAGKIEMEQVDTAVSRHLQKKFELGLFEAPYIEESRVLEVFETVSQRELAQQIARQSMVLLTNDGLLPLPKSISTLAVIGPNADNARNLSGDYSYEAMQELQIFQQPPDSAFIDLDPSTLQHARVKIPTVLEAIRAVLPDAVVLAARGCEINGQDQSGFAEAVEIARQADAVVLVLGDKSGLTLDCTSGETRDSADLALPGVQMELARAVLATGKPVAVVLINGRPLAIPELAQSASAILEAWIPGEEGGAAIASVLFGDHNPGGKLAITFPRSVGQVPLFYNHKRSGSRSNWYTHYVAESIDALFPFGHGLSYTHFEYTDMQISKARVSVGESLELAFVVTNRGQVAGDEVVQLYIQDEFASFPRPVKELKAFKRITLQPGQAKRIVFHLPVNLLAFYDSDLNLIVEKGRILVMAGSSSEDIRLTGQFEITGPDQMLVENREYGCPVEVQ